jgi:hypothetical protein
MPARFQRTLNTEISLSKRYKLFVIGKFSMYSYKTSQKSTDHTMNTKYTLPAYINH